MINSKIITVSIYDLLPSPHQPRVDESEGLEELKESISSMGLINRPKVIAHPTLPQKYIIQTGHRRIKALKELNVQTIEVELLEEEDSRIPLIDNMLRVDLHVTELADAIVSGFEEEIFTDIDEIVNLTGISEKDVKSMIKFGNKLNSYVISFLLQNKNMIFSNSLEILELLGELCELKPGKKIIMEVLKEIKEREDEDGANIKLFKELIKKQIEKAKVTTENTDEKEDEKQEKKECILKEKEENTDEAIDGNSNFNKSQNEEPSTFLDMDFDLEDEILIEEEDGEMNLSEYENKIKDLGLEVKYDDDWRNIQIKINIDEMSDVSETKLKSIFEKILKKF